MTKYARIHKVSAWAKHVAQTAGHNLLPNHCLLCHGSTRHAICAECHQDLPAPTIKCKICGLPFAGTTGHTRAAKPPVSAPPLSHTTPLSNSAPLSHYDYPCGTCQTKPPSFDSTITAFEYRFPVDQLIEQFKNQQHLCAGDFLSKALAQEIHIRNTEAHPKISCLVPVPIHWKKHVSRQFNQSAFIAKTLSKILHIPLAQTLIKKHHHTVDQKSLNRRERLSNLKQAFTVLDSVEGENIAIVDDVMTTGSTMEILAKKLKQAGANHVEAWAIARA